MSRQCEIPPHSPCLLPRPSYCCILCHVSDTQNARGGFLGVSMKTQERKTAVSRWLLIQKIKVDFLVFLGKDDVSQATQSLTHEFIPIK